MADIHIFSTMAVQRAIKLIEPGFTAFSGCTLRTEFASTADLRDRIQGGESADVAILTEEWIAGLMHSGKLAQGMDGGTALVRSYIGMAVKAGAPHPDISTKDAFINTLLNAKSLSYSRNGASGLYLKDLLVQLGVAEQVNARAIILNKGFTAELAATGQVDLALQQISELMSVSGIELVGRLPDGVQLTTIFAAGIFATSPQRNYADQFIQFCRLPSARQIFEHCGLEPV